jgi:hypothetical protein
VSIVWKRYCLHRFYYERRMRVEGRQSFEICLAAGEHKARGRPVRLYPSSGITEGVFVDAAAELGRETQERRLQLVALRARKVSACVFT